jgi:flagellar basal-body rod protein FlgB
MADILENIKDHMRYLNQKQAIIASNIANANIPNAKTHTLEEFKLDNKSSNIQKVKMSTTSKLHIGGNNTNQKFKTIKSKDTFENSINGNNINLVEETTKMQETSMDYKTMIEAYKKINSLVKTAISSK